MRALSDSSSNVFVLIGAAWRRQALAAAMSSVFANAARQLLGFVTGSSGMVQAQAAAPDPPVNLTREHPSELPPRGSTMWCEHRIRDSLRLTLE